MPADRTPAPVPPAEPPDGTMLLALDPTPGYEGVFVGVWHRRDDGAWSDGEHRWFSSYCRRMPNQPYTWPEALARGAQPDRPLIEAAAGVAAGRTAAAAEVAEKLRAEADDEAQRPGRHQNCCSRAIETWLHEAAHIAEGTDHAG